MPDLPADDLHRRARFLMIAAIVVDLAAIVAILLPALQGGDVMSALPIAIPLFVVSSLLLVASIGTKKKADTAGG